jgi:hypothetical protein
LRRRLERGRGTRIVVSIWGTCLVSCSLLTDFDVSLGVAPPAPDAPNDSRSDADEARDGGDDDRAAEGAAILSTSFEDDVVFCGFEIGRGTAERVAEGRTGNHACKLCGPGGEITARIQMYVSLPPAPGRYAAKVWIRRPTEDAAARPSMWDIRFLSASDGGSELPPPSSGSLDSTWRPANHTATLVMDPYRLRLRLGSEDQGLTSDDCLLVDDLEVHRLLP